MKATLLSIMALGVCGAALATGPYVQPGSVISSFSLDKKVGVSAMYGNLFLFDLEDPGNDPKIFEASEDGLGDYVPGLGNNITNTDLCVYRGKGGSSLYRWGSAGPSNGRWISINSKESGTGMDIPNAITPDGTRICGNVATGVEFGIDVQGTMVVPCIWEVNGNQITRSRLTCPEEDYAGMKPQYVTAVCISDDGKTIIGQVISNNGFFKEYVIYSQNDEGIWSFRKPFDHLVNPNNREWPAYPSGEEPVFPDPSTYMTEEQVNEYYAALDAWREQGGDESTMPNVGNYMDPDSISKYNAAVEYNNQWQAAYQAWAEADLQIRNESTNFVQNQCVISPNGRYLAASIENAGYYDENMQWNGSYAPFLYDIENDQILVSSGPSILVTGVNDNGDMIGYVRDQSIEFGYVLPAGATSWTPLEEWVVERHPEYKEWVEKNWKHTVIVEIVDPDGGSSTYDYQEMYITGMPFMSRDWTMLSAVAYQFWANADYPQEYCSAIVPLDGSASITEVHTPVQAADNAVYNLQGIRVSDATAPGIYIKNGSKFIVR